MHAHPSRFRTIAMLVAATTTASASPIALHPGNPHYFAWKGEPTILITSGEHYGALLNLDFDFRRYFGELASHGLNHSRVFSGVYREVPGDFGINDNPLAPLPGKFSCPWVRSEQPGESDGGNKFDLDRWDPAYFERLHELMTDAAERGIVVEFTLFCPMYSDSMWNACPMNARNNINGIGECAREEVYALKHEDLTSLQARFVKKVAAELRGFDNLYFEICNEPYFGGVTDHWQHRMINELVAVDQGRHLISLNIANGRKRVVDPHPAVSIFNFHYCVPPDTVTMNYGLNKVIGENETGFRGSADVLYRTEAWDFLLAGGALYNNLDYSFTPKHPEGTLRGFSSPGGGSRELRAQLKILKDFLGGFEFIHMRPDAEVVAKTDPPLTSSSLGLSGKSYAIYLHTPLPNKPEQIDELLRTGRSAKVRLALPAGKYRLDWLDPVSGKFSGPQLIDHGTGELEIETPVFDDDVALRVTATVGGGQ